MKYTLIETKYIKDIDSTISIYIHNKTKAHIYFISNDDNNKYFSIAFKTPPKDNTGLNHILEHSVLCGSNKYRVKDPFINLAKSSLNTFLNAMTFPDKTVYPIASQNDKDFNNLMDVYLDAVFNPLIYEHEEIFMQEGHHLEIKDGKPYVNGVVYSEMKGVYSDPQSILVNKIFKTLYPNTIYKYDSGGNPNSIPKLTYQEFISYHKKYYHPSNSFIYLYGNINIEEKLEYLDTYLSKYEYQYIPNKIKLEKNYLMPVYASDTYYSINKNDKTYLSYNVCLKDNKDLKLLIASTILLNILFNVTGAPITKKLVSKGYCENVDILINNDIKQPSFSIILTGSSKQLEDKVIDLINNEFARYIEKGLPKKQILSALSFNEFKLKENLLLGPYRGLTIILDSLTTSLYKPLDPYSQLESTKYFEALREDIDNGYFEEVLSKVFLNNWHKSYVSLTPTDKVKETYIPKVKEKDYDNIIKQNEKLKEYQNSPDDISCLPTLNLEDLNSKVNYKEIKIIDRGYKTYYSEYFTNDICYHNYYFDISNLNNDDIIYLNILLNLLRSLPTKKHQEKDITKIIMNYSGGLSFNISNFIKKDSTYKPYIKISFSALTKNIKKINDLILDIINNSQLKKDTIYEQLVQMKTSFEANLPNNASNLASLRSNAKFSESSYFNEITLGITSYKIIKDIVLNYESRYEELTNKFNNLLKLAFNKDRFFSHLTLTNNLLDDNLKHVDYFYHKLESNNYHSEFIYQPNIINEAFITPYKVNFVALAYKQNVSNRANYLVLRNILTNEYLWQEVRVLGGAYGANYSYRQDGMVSMSSFRDPNIIKTINTFSNIDKYISDLTLTDRELLNYKIGVFGSLDYPSKVVVKGNNDLYNYLINNTLDDILKLREDIINLNLEDIHSIAKEIKEGSLNKVYCVIGNNEQIEENKALFDEIINL